MSRAVGPQADAHFLARADPSPDTLDELKISKAKPTVDPRLDAARRK